ncbi:MAG: amino acid adenylation domain-containing protein [Aphanothece sp. CMT-3BRIN-NPC111]|jgi:amino acid adenylation domain-containing protein|nr:amino acid adenylation domain-containing protein [Aphanothece sp. CMT-3BRIN-NPC111]
MTDLINRISALSPEKRELLLQRLKKTENLSETQIKPQSRASNTFPLSFAQQRLWFLDQMEPGNPFYNIPTAVRLKGRLNVVALEQSFNEIIKRHEGLRTTFTTVEGKPVQAIAPSLSLTLPVVDLRDLPQTQQEQKVQLLVTQEAQIPFNLMQGPLLRVRLLQLSHAEYVMLFTTHHIVSDIWSTGVLIREVATLYSGFCAGSPSSLPQLPIQYADFAVWQQQWLSGEVLETQLNYWKQHLNRLPMLQLPTDRPRPAVATFQGAQQSFVLSKALTEALKALSQREGVTLFMTLLAAFKVLLHRYTGQDDIPVGSPIANRNREEIEGLIGFFVNTLVLRTDLSDNPSFRELLGRVREVTLGAYAHQDLPFEKLVEELQPDRNLSYNPLFQVVFQLQNAPMPALELPDLSLSVLDIHNHTAKVDLHLSLGETNEGLSGAFEYSTDLFDAATIARMLSHFQNLLEGIVANPDRSLLDLPLLTQPEQHQLLLEWNNTQQAELFKDVCFHQLFEAQAEQTPDAVALVFQNQQLTYRELNQRANQLAHYLQKLGVKPEVLVGICLERSLDMVVALLGVLKAGGAYVPLDPAYPKKRLAFMLEDAQVQVLLTQQQFLNTLPSHNAKVVCLDTDWKVIQTLKLKTQNSKLKTQNSSNLAYVIYTSGSTGRPKGVLVAHRGLYNLSQAQQQLFDVQPDSRILQFASLNFDASVWEVVMALGLGATLVLASRDTLLDSSALMQLLREEAITIVTLPPSVLAVLPSEDLPALRTIIVAGEACSPDLVAQWAPGRRFFNAYGPTETTVCATVAECTEGDRKLPIGRPIANTQIYILDTQLQPVPIGVPGEMYIGGISLARGYLNRPDLTADRFITNPFSQETKSRLYKTGDLARYLPDGNIEFLGRIDQQVKLRGFRIELEEIEATLKQHSALQDAIALVREDTPGDKRLIAYIVANSSSNDLEENQKELPAEQISQWRSLYDETYSQTTPTQDPTLNITGWNSSYTDQPLPAEEMRQWVESTVERVLSLKPKRVLEIGCGSGLLLFRIAPHCTQYVGCDFSQPALNYIQQQLKMPERALPQVSLFHRMADNFEGVETAAFDAVIINSVVQYFPNIDYLLRVLEGAACAVAPGGFIFLGDVRSLPLLEAFHTSVQLYQAPDTLPTTELRQRIQKRIAQEEELVIDPAFFTALQQHLPQITHVQIQPKRGHYNNELSKFRYDAILHVGTEVETSNQDSRIAPLFKGGWGDLNLLDWQQQKLTLASVSELLESTQPEILGLRHIPNPRLATEVKALELLANDEAPETVGELRSTLAEITQEAGIEPEDFWALGDKFPYSIDISWLGSSADGIYDVVFRRRTTLSPPFQGRLGGSPIFPSRNVIKPWNAYANNPLQGKVARDLAPQLRDYLQEKLPDYMVPSAFVVLDALPLTPNGKVDRKALPSPDLVRLDLEDNYLAARNLIEEQLASIFSEVLGIEQVGVNDNFFDVGGHSLIATQVMSRVRDTFDIELPLRCLFESPTVGGLAESVKSAFVRRTVRSTIASPTPLFKGGFTEAPPIQRVSRNQELPLSFAQQRLWFLSQLAPESPLYNVPAAVRLTGSLNVAALEQSFNEVVRRHEILRTSFATVEGRPIQVISPTCNLQLPVIELDSEQETEVQRLAKAEALKPFDLAYPPLLRVTLLRLNSTDHVLLLTMHHIVSDGWSMGVLIQELATLYEALSAGKPSPLPELSIQYADFAVWQRQWLQGEVLEAKLTYWKQLLGGNPPALELPTDKPRSHIQTFQGASQTCELSLNLSKRLQELSNQENVTLYMTLLAAFQTLLHRYTNQDDIVVGTDIANRTRSETEALIGFFVNLLVLRTDMRGNPSFRELLQRVRELTLKAYTHQDLPFEKLVEELRPERNLNHTPLFQVLFVFQNTPSVSIKLSHLTLHPLEVKDEMSKFDLALFVTETEQGIIVNWKYSTDLFSESAIARMSNNFETLLSSIVKQPDSRLNALEMLTAAEKQKQFLEQKKRKEVNFSKFKMVKPKAVSLPEKKLIKTDYLEPGQTLPLVVEPAIEDIDIADWAKNNREFVETQLLKHGAILFRGFNTNSVSEFENFAQAICPELFGEYGDLPREGVGGKVYGSTPYPPDKAILFHNESSHMHRWPMKIWFFCVQPAQQRGETPIVDCRKVYQLLDPKLRERFAQKQLMYVRNYTEGLDVNWTEFFHTSDKTVVEDYCRQNSIAFEWKDNNSLRTREIRPAVTKHPQTGEMVFFNQIQLHHISCLDSDVRESLLSLFGEENLPRHVYYGDGTPIEDSIVEEISAVYREATISFPWQKGDILMLDNMLTAHGRNPYVGPRKIVVAMGEIISNEDIKHKSLEANNAITR